MRVAGETLNHLERYGNTKSPRVEDVADTFTPTNNV